ncbi:MAG: hypothetical protein IIY70_02820 [Oscillospiraceae bacterium]|nr:hypothetical protein [Oscillospiraceae bacterium]
MMDEREFLFFQGSTPTLELVLPLAVSLDDLVHATFYQMNYPVLSYYMDGMYEGPESTGLLRDPEEENVLLLCMTRNETLQLAPGDVELQIDLRNDVGSDTFRPLLGRIGPMRRSMGGAIQE